MSTLADRSKQLHGERRRAYKAHADRVREATQELDLALARIDADLEKLDQVKADPPVLVRNTPGPRVEIFHSAEDPCGKVNPAMVKLGRFDELRLGEALVAGLRPCTACASAMR